MQSFFLNFFIIFFCCFAFDDEEKEKKLFNSITVSVINNSFKVEIPKVKSQLNIFFIIILTLLLVYNLKKKIEKKGENRLFSPLIDNTLNRI